MAITSKPVKGSGPTESLRPPELGSLVRFSKVIVFGSYCDEVGPTSIDPWPPWAPATPGIAPKHSTVATRNPAVRFCKVFLYIVSVPSPEIDCTNEKLG